MLKFGGYYQMWLGCPLHPCLSGNFDAVTTVLQDPCLMRDYSDSYQLILSGKYVWVFNKSSTSDAKPRLIKDFFKLDVINFDSVASFVRPKQNTTWNAEGYCLRDTRTGLCNLKSEFFVIEYNERRQVELFKQVNGKCLKWTRIFNDSWGLDITNEPLNDGQEFNGSCNAIEFMTDETIYNTTRRKMRFSQRYLNGELIVVDLA